MEVTVNVPVGADRVSVLGSGERHLKMIRETLGVNITARDGLVSLKGDRRSVGVARRVLERLHEDSPRRGGFTRQDVLDVITDEAARARSSPDLPDEEADEFESPTPRTRSAQGWEAAPGRGVSVPRGPLGWEGPLGVYASGVPVRPRTPNQDRYLEAIRTHDLIFGIGPAGTGKTYLAVAAAVHLLKQDRVRKIVLVRPAVEAGEKLGFLPGDMAAKVNPYLRPLLDALHDMMDFATIRRFMESDVVEIAPLAFMRGRTLNQAVIILDEAQNTTKGQMKMFLTRLGHGSKMIVTGDVTQIDLPDPGECGLIDAARRLARTPGVAFAGLDRGDVVRHNLVQRIVEAYGGDESRHPEPHPTTTHPTPTPPAATGPTGV